MLFLNELDYGSADHAARHAADSIVDHIIPLEQSSAQQKLAQFDCRGDSGS